MAWREKGGRWMVQRGGEAGSGLMKKERVVFPTHTDALPPEAGVTLDSLLNDAGIFEEKPSGEAPYAGSLNSTMEIVSPAGRRTVCWSARLSGKLGAVADRVIGPY